MPIEPSNKPPTVSLDAIQTQTMRLAYQQQQAAIEYTGAMVLKVRAELGLDASYLFDPQQGVFVHRPPAEAKKGPQEVPKATN